MPNPYIPQQDQLIEPPWGEAVVSRVTLTFPTVTEANAYYAAQLPDPGQLRVIESPGIVQLFDGDTWIDVHRKFDAYGWRDPRASWGLLAAANTVAGQAGQDIAGPDTETLVSQAGFAPLAAVTVPGRMLWIYGTVNLVSNHPNDVMVNVRLRRDGVGGTELKNGLVTVRAGYGTTRVPVTMSYFEPAPGGSVTYALTVTSGYGAPGAFRVTHPCGLTVNDQGPASQSPTLLGI